MVVASFLLSLFIPALALCQMDSHVHSAPDSGRPIIRPQA
jgi:hypothetical protein